MTDHNISDAAEQQAKVDKVLARIKKMLALANDAGATDGERETALAMAHKLMVKFNIDAAQVASLDDNKIEEGRGKDTFIWGKEMWALRTAQAVCKLFMCEFYFQTSALQKSKAYYCVIGTQMNVSAAKLLSEFVLASIHRQARVAAYQAGHKPGGAFGRFMRSFCEAAGLRICRRVLDILEAQRTANEPVPGTALVVQNLYDSEQEKNKNWIAEHTGELKQRNSKGARVIDRDAYSKGDEYGRSVHLGKHLEKDAEKEQIA